jgi:hypothetical protein
MPGFPFPGRPGGEPDEPLLDMIIARRVLPPDAPQPMHDLATMLAALAGPAESGELAGEAAVRVAFSRAASPAGISAAARRPGRRRRARGFRGPARSRARLAAALVVAVAGLGSVVAAYIDVLPSPIQQLAHVTVAAPAPPSSGPRHTGAAGTPLDKRASNRPSSQPDSRPQHSTSPAQRPGQLTPSPNFKPGSPGRRTPRPSCTPVPGHSPSPQPRPTGRPSPPSWSPPVRCTGLPTGPSGGPTLYPYPYTHIGR